MDSRACEYFTAIADQGGFSRAAEHLHVTQPALSVAMRKLERELGAALFHRVGRRVVLSEAGEVFLESARRVLRELEEAEATMRALRGLSGGRVTIAAPPSLSARPLARLVGLFRRRFPAVTVTMAPTEDGALAAAAVLSAACELALTDRPTGAGALREHFLAANEMVVVVPPSFFARDAFAPGTGPVSLADLAGTPFISSLPGTRARSLLDEALAAGVDIPAVVQTPHREAVIPLILEGVGAAFLTDKAAAEARRLGAVVRSLEPRVTYQVCLAHRRGPLTAAAGAFVQLALEDLRSGPPSAAPLTEAS
jgi:DNA-binding transcriptional LysR family regulator